MKDGIDILNERIAELEAVVEEQRLRLEVLVKPAEEATGKQGSTALLTYIARLETKADSHAELLEALEKIEEILGYKYAGEDEIDKAYPIIETALQKAQRIADAKD